MNIHKRIIASATAIAVGTASCVVVPQAFAADAPAAATSVAPTSEPGVADKTGDKSGAGAGNTTVEPSLNAPAGETAVVGQDTTIAEFPVPTFTKSNSKSTISVKGTQKFDKDLELKPEGTGNVDVTINVNGKVPNGTKIGIYNGEKKLGESTVEDGRVAVSAKDLPKDANTFQLKASNNVKLSGMTCTADKGIDIPESTYATEDAIDDWEKAYADAKQKYERDVANAKFRNENAGAGGKTITSVIPGTTTTIEMEGGNGGKKTTVKNTDPQEIVNSIADPTGGKAGKDKKGVDTDLLKKILIPLGTIAGAVGLGSLLGPEIDKAIKNFTANGRLEIPSLPNVDLNGMFQGAMKAFQDGGANLRKWGDNVRRQLENFGAHGIQLPNLDQVRRDAEGKIEQLKKMAADAAANLGAQLDGVVHGAGGIGKNIEEQIKRIPSEQLIGGLAALILIPTIIGLIVGLKNKQPGNKGHAGTDGNATKKTTTTISGTPTTIVEGSGQSGKTLKTSVVPPKTTTIVQPAGDGGSVNIPTPNAPQPPKFIEKTLGQRSVPVRPVSNGAVEFDIETGSVLDCSVKATGGNKDDGNKGNNKGDNQEKSTPNSKNNNTPNNNRANNTPANNNARAQQPPALVAPQRVATPVAADAGPKVNTGGSADTFFARFAHIFR